MARTATTLTEYTNEITIFTIDSANSLYGGLYSTIESRSLDSEDPLVVGHVHDGQRLDGHAPRIDMLGNVVGELDGQNLGDLSISANNIYSDPVQSAAIPEHDGFGTFFLDLSEVTPSVSALFQKKAGYQWGRSYPTIDSMTDGIVAPGTGLLSYSGLSGRLYAYPYGDGMGIGDAGRYGYVVADDAGNEFVGWQGGTVTKTPSIAVLNLTSGNMLPRLSIKISISRLADARFFVGLTDDAGAISGGDNPNHNYVFFQYSGANLRGDTNWQLAHNIVSGTQTIIDTGVAAAVNTVLLFEFEYLTSTSVRLSIFDETYNTALYTVVTTVQPAGSVNMNSAFAMGEWTGASTQELLRFYGAVLVNQNRV